MMELESAVAYGGEWTLLGMAGHGLAHRTPESWSGLLLALLLPEDLVQVKCLEKYLKVYSRATRVLRRSLTDSLVVL